MIKAYYLLAKPGIIYGNALTAIGGYFLALRGTFDLSLFLTMLFGLSLVIGSACVFNNVIDKEIDAKMARTKTVQVQYLQLGLEQHLPFLFVLIDSQFKQFIIFPCVAI